MDEAADQLVETDSSAVIMRTIARITMQPLPRYGKARFIDLNGPLRMCMRIPQTRDIDERKLTKVPTPENSDNAPKGSPLGSQPAMVSPRTPRFRATIDAGTFTAQIPIAELTARPTEAYVPRFRALALFGRRLPERMVKSSLAASENLHMSRH
jgi:hypothetical protein